jgi:hypothetical protein
VIHPRPLTRFFRIVEKAGMWEPEIDRDECETKKRDLIQGRWRRKGR